MSSTDSEDDPSFVALPARLRQRIDGAFDSIASRSGTELTSQYEAGGFIIEDLPSNSLGASTHILLSEIPHALNLLDLLPDDDIMGVFENAAAGWGTQNGCSEGVSRKDWRAVCAALLEGEGNTGADEDVEMSGSDSDEFRAEELSSDSEEPSSDEVSETSAKSRKMVRKSPTKSSGPQSLTESQKARCRQDFGRFFPHIPDDELDRQRIMIKDVTRVASLLKENIKTEEILEMLEAFSTSPDKSMTLQDFERMMILTKLV